MSNKKAGKQKRTIEYVYLCGGGGMSQLHSGFNLWR